MPHKHATPARLEGFSDGVLAVIITIMVLELKVPREDGIPGLRSIFPTLLVYALSFTLTGVYWINHRHLIDRIDDRIERIDEAILYANLLLLFCLSLLPFFTAYVLAKHLDPFSVALYACSNVVSGFSFMLLRLSVLRRLRRSNALTPQDVAGRAKDLISLTAYLTAIPLALYHPYLSLALLFAITFIWILPSVGVEPREENASQPALPRS